jgi:signal transduction histidine kinase/DNA-binding NarL/FixJ family response regulator
MSIRSRAFLIIIISNLLIILFSVFLGITYARKNMKKTIETDMMVVANIADHFVSAELELLRLHASDAARYITEQEKSNLSDILRKTETLYPQFLGMAILNYTSLAASAGKSPASAEILDNKYIKRAFLGEKSFTSTCPTENGVVFYLAVPIPELRGHILVVTIPGVYFSEKTSSFTVWKTGHIFIDDSEGTVIANIREEWVQQRSNFIRMGEIDRHYAEMGGVIGLASQGNIGIGYFSVGGIPRLCAYRPISGSKEGWFLGIIAPLPESPVKNLNRGLFLVGGIAFLLSLTAAIIASYFIKKPFEEAARLKEEAESHLRSKSDFLANMSHEIRTPLNVVIGLTELVLEDDTLDKHVTENLIKISNAGGTLLSIVNDILDFSKIESGKLTLSPVEYYMSSVLNDVITLVVTRLGEKPIIFSLNIPDDLPAKLYGDDLRVKQILTNLLSNSIKYTHRGSIELNVNCKREGCFFWMEIVVSDTGIGIRKDDVEKLFLDYFQADTKANRNIEGTGLGLPITKRLVEMMDGEINAESEYGKGTTFRLRIKQGFVEDTTLGTDVAEKLRSFRYTDDKRTAAKRLVRLNLSYAKVLVVDDMQTNLDVASGLLRKYNMQVDCLNNGQDTVDRIYSGNPVYDAIFMDHMMPGMDGIETADKIRALGREYAQKIPIIALTANAIHGTEELFFQHGFQAFISKPIDIMELDSVIRKWVRSETKEKELGTNAFLTPDTSSEDESDKDEINIPGVDSEKGLSLYGYDKKIYISLLRSFVGNTLENLKKLRTVSKETLPDYVITVHGLKGTSAGLGAELIREEALNLENLSRAGNLDEVLALNNKLIEDTEIVVNNIKEWLAGYDSRNAKVLLKAPDRKILARLRQCCENFDMSGIDKAMTELESFNYEEDAELVAWLRDKINVSEINEAAARLIKILI